MVDKENADCTILTEIIGDRVSIPSKREHMGFKSRVKFLKTALIINNQEACIEKL